MTNQEKIDAVLHAVRHSKGNERLLKLGLGCEVISVDYEGNPSKHVYVYKDKGEERMVKMYSIERDEYEWYKKPNLQIIGHPVKWSDVLVAVKEVNKSLNISQLGELFEIKNGERNYLKVCDLTLTPEEAMQKDEDLTDFLFKLLIDKV